MNALFERVNLIEEILDKPFSKQAKVIRSMQQFSGLDLTNLSSEIKAILETQLVRFDEILSQYKIKTFDDYQKISKEHLKDLIVIMRNLCQDLRLNLGEHGGTAGQHGTHQSCSCPHH